MAVKGTAEHATAGVRLDRRRQKAHFVTDPDTTRRDALVERLFETTLGTLELFSVHLGWRLGLYGELATPTRSPRPSWRRRRDRRALRARVARAAGGRGLPRSRGRRRAGRRAPLPAPGRARRRADRPREPRHAGALRADGRRRRRGAADVLEAYRSGDGVPYERYGADFRDGQGLINRPTFTREMAGWLASSRDPRPRSRADGRARRRRRLRPGLLDGRDRARLRERDGQRDRPRRAVGRGRARVRGAERR